MSATQTAVSPLPGLGSSYQIWPLPEAQFQRMLATGILRPDDPVELVDGFLVGLDLGGIVALPKRCVLPNDPPRLLGRALWPLTLEQYRRMNAEGILHGDDPLELLDGYMVAMDRGKGPGMPPAPEHAYATCQLNRSLGRSLPLAWVVRCQDPIELGLPGVPGAASAPQPDLCVVEGPDARYSHRHPTAADLRLVAEVADSSLLNDRRDKAKRYAQAGTSLYWIVNLVDRRLEVYSDPDPATTKYQTLTLLGESEQVTLAWPGLAPVTFAVRDFLP